MRSCVAGLLLSFCSLIGHAQVTPPFPLPQSGQSTYPVASYLEAKFQDQLNTCMGTRFLSAHTGIFGHHKIAISAIPKPLLEDGNVQLKDTVLPELNESVARLFAYVYSTKSVQEHTLQDSYLDIDYLQSPATMLPLGLNSTLYNYSCASNIAWALKSDDGYKWPIAEISSALQADYSNNSTAQLGMVFGTFRSPLYKLYQGADNDWKAYATLIMWEWYDQNPDRRGAMSPGYLLKEFDGVSAYRLHMSKEAVSGKLGFSAKLVTPVVSVDSSGNTQYDSSETIRAENFSVAVKSNIAESDFASFPASSTLATTLPTSARLDATSTDGRLLASDMKHTQILDGVPVQWCSSDHWHVINHHKSAVGNLHLVDGGTKAILPSKDSGRPPSCAFAIEYSDAVPDDKIVLDYLLVSSIGNQEDINDDNAAGVPDGISVHTQPVRLTATGKPIIDSTDSHGTYSVVQTDDQGKKFHDFKWNDLHYKIEEDPQDKIASVEQNPHLKLVCGTANRVISINATGTYDSVNSDMLVIPSHSANDDLEKLDFNSSDDICVLSGSIALTLHSGAIVPKTLPNTNIYYPKAASSPITVTSFTPLSGPSGTSVTIIGTGLAQASKISFGGIAATAFTVQSDTHITATVPPGAPSGKIQVVTPAATLTAATDFTVTQ